MASTCQALDIRSLAFELTNTAAEQSAEEFHKVLLLVRSFLKFDSGHNNTREGLLRYAVCIASVVTAWLASFFFQAVFTDEQSSIESTKCTYIYTRYQYMLQLHIR